MKLNEQFTIDIAENGYIITANDVPYIFNNINDMIKWVEDNIELTGESKKFSDALDDDITNDEREPEDYSKFAQYNTQYNTPTYTTTTNVPTSIGSNHPKRPKSLLKKRNNHV